MTVCRRRKAGCFAPEFGKIDKATRSHVPLSSPARVLAFSSDLISEPRLQLLAFVMSTAL